MSERVDIATPAFRADPYTPYAVMRREAPVARWILAGCGR